MGCVCLLPHVCVCVCLCVCVCVCVCLRFTDCIFASMTANSLLYLWCAVVVMCVLLCLVAPTVCCAPLRLRGGLSVSLGLYVVFRWCQFGALAIGLALHKTGAASHAVRTRPIYWGCAEAGAKTHHGIGKRLRQIHCTPNHRRKTTLPEDGNCQRPLRDISMQPSVSSPTQQRVYVIQPPTCQFKLRNNAAFLAPHPQCYAAFHMARADTGLGACPLGNMRRRDRNHRAHIG